ncbi:DUF885 family protein [Anditalea andensis]|uniref:X-Pro dipeptidyl-peptidase n=1 Tax=Anditalea andensis TaxID=1048983 RepID=A0A074KPM2_9BACT|nr:DUF885 family protein [Anditalea andensis]KEO71906.1 X-Pro dipeptidyl-peptidase [Anditalea andensis]
MKIGILFLFFSLVHSNIYGHDLYSEIESFRADHAALSRKYTNIYTPEYFERMEQLYKEWLNKIEVFDFSNASKDAQIDYLLFKNKLRKELHFHSLSYASYKEISHVMAFSSPLELFYIERRAGKKQDGKALARQFNETTLAINKLHQDIKSSEPFDSWQKAELASEVIKSLRIAVEEAYQFYFDYDPDFSWWLKAPYHQLSEALAQYETFLSGHYTNKLVKDDGSGIIGKPIGKKAILKELEYEFIPYSPEDLIAEAEKQFAWCEKEMLLATQELDYGNQWKEALEYVKNTYVPPGQWPEDIHYLAEEAIKFLEERDLVTIPDLAKETWRMKMMSPEAQRVNPFFLGGEVIQISYPTSTMSHDEKMMSMRGNNPHFSRATVQHELIPGHHLQNFMTQRYKPYRRIFSTPFWIEGWALYWEFNLWDKDFPISAEDKIGMLFWRMHRCARIIFSLNYHLEKMTPQECIDFLVDKLGHEKANAEAEVRRSFEGRYGPLYQIAYMIGGLQFYSLNNEYVKSGKMSEKDFHDFILQQNSIPVELIRLQLSDKQIPKEYTTSWKFLD